MNDQEVSILKQSPGADPKLKRNSGLFSFLRWFKSSSRESVNSDPQTSISTGTSGGSTESLNSTGTVASFSYIPPDAYNNKVTNNKCISPGPETDTYKARLKQRDKIRERDKNITLRKKYNLFFNRDSLVKSSKKVQCAEEEEDNSKSLPLMTRKMEDERGGHRRTNSDSSKQKKAGAYLHVKGKRKAPQPPRHNPDGGNSTLSLRRKKRLAPQPPPTVHSEAIMHSLERANDDHIVYADADVICNDSLKLEHGVLRAVKVKGDKKSDGSNGSPNASARSSIVEAPVSPRLWYKRNTKKEHKYEPIEAKLLTTAAQHQKLDKKEEKRKSGMMFLTNISELDREATEIIKKEHKRNNENVLTEMPEFMKPKQDEVNADTLSVPKRKSAKDLIAKFNAITNVTKVTVNSALFGGSNAKPAKDYFGRPISNKTDTTSKSNRGFVPLMKCETSACIIKPGTPKQDRRPWNCPKCNVENDYWRIICHVCSTIKPYFDDLSAPPPKNSPIEPVNNERRHVAGPAAGASAEPAKNTAPTDSNGNIPQPERVLERSRTQIGFTNNNNNDNNKRDEREKLKKMLIEMKNSLPKRKSHVINNPAGRKSTIDEDPELDEQTNLNKRDVKLEEIEKTFVKKEEEVVKQATQANKKSSHSNYQLMRPKDFEEIYGEKTGKTNITHLYANLAQHENLFLNVPKKLTDMKHSMHLTGNAGTIEINRLLRRLENAIAKGDLSNAAIFARELAHLKVSCSVIRQKPIENDDAKANNGFTIEMYVEDRLSHRGPFPIHVVETQTVAELKEQVEREFEIPIDVQRWILGKELATNDAATLKDHKVTNDKCPVFLYLVAPVNNNNVKEEKILNTVAQNNGVKEDRVLNTNILPQTSASNGVKTYTPNALQNSPLSRIKNEKILITKDNSQNSSFQDAKEDAKVLNKTNLSSAFSNIKVEKPSNTNNLPQTSSYNGVKNEQVLKIVEQNSNDKHVPIHEASRNVIKVIPHASANNNNVNEIKIINTSQNHIIKPSNATTILNNNNNVAKATALVIQHPIIVETKEINLPKNTIQTVIIENKTKPLIIENKQKEAPKIVGEQFKAQIKVVEKTKVDIAINTPSSSGVNKRIDAKQPPKAIQEDFTEYDKTLRPQKSWECRICTLINPVTTNVCLVCSSIRQKEPTPPEKVKRKQAGNKKHYMELMDLDSSDLVHNNEPFECLICLTTIDVNEGVTLRECLHQFCKACLAHTIEFCDEAEVKCPYRDKDYSCDIALQDREVKALVTPAVYEQFLTKSVSQAENRIGKSFHCKTPDCKGWCIFEDNVNEFRCPVCQKTNCLTCQAIHFGLNCKQYQERMNAEAETDEDAKRTREMLEEMVSKGEALTCPACQVVLMKKWGCDWVRCSMCKTEICWVTRGLRWGPGGKGDTSGGCKCGVNGMKCHPQCSYCH